jgi:AcrR family transcriptional regulator
VGRKSLQNERRAQILDACEEIVREEGLSAAFPTRVAGRVGIDRTTVYHYFPTQSELLGGLVERIIDGYMAHDRELESKLRPGADIGELVDFMLSSSFTLPHYDRVLAEIQAVSYRDEEVAKHVSRFYYALEESVVSLLVKVLPDAPIERVRETAYSLHPLIEGTHLLQGHGIPEDRLIASGRTARHLVEELRNETNPNRERVMMSIEHLPSDTSSEKISEVLERDGCVIIDGVLGRADIDQVTLELAPYIEAAPKGQDPEHGFETKRVGTLIGRSPKAREIITNRILLEVSARQLSHAASFQIHLTERDSVGPGSAAQEIHRDQPDFNEVPIPHGYETLVSSIWALTDFTEENGATRVVPGSHQLAEAREYSLEESEPAVMEAGSVLLFTGKLYHGAGANGTDVSRESLLIVYSLGWLRQEENQYLGIPIETLRELPEDLLRLMGYTCGDYLLGFIDGGRDPIIAVRPEFERPMSSFLTDASGEAN